MTQGQLFATTDRSSVVVFDFETTGMSPQQGDRVIEVGAVRLEAGQIVAHFESLINPEISLDPFISELTGISDQMLSDAPGARQVINDFHEFAGSAPLVAHNASFDKRFLDAEFELYSLPAPAQVGCSMLAARRLFPDAPNHKLGTLISYLELPTARRFHRALADASMTAVLWRRLEQELIDSYGFSEIPFNLLLRLGQVSVSRVPEFLRNSAKKQQEGRGC
jgi:DNA polymerase-3 subunit epsilon